MSDKTATVVKTGIALLSVAATTYLIKRGWKTVSAKPHSDRYFIGIDLGATNAKASVVRDDGELISFSSEPLTDYTDKGVVDTLVKVATTAVEKAGLKFTDVCEIGVGSPGTIDFDVQICFTLSIHRTGWLLRLRTSLPGTTCLLPS